MPWEVGELDGSREVLDTDNLAPGPDYEDDEHVFFANVAYRITTEEIVGACTQDSPPHLTAAKVVGIRMMCGRCGLIPDGANLLAIHEPCPG